MKRIIKILSLSLLLISCSGQKYSPVQYQDTLRNISCYKDLIKEISENEDNWLKLIEIRNRMRRSRGDVITVDKYYRLVQPNELTDYISENWKTHCQEKLEKRDDFRGLRIPNREIIIIEIDEIRRSTFGTQYLTDNIKEFHRLVKIVDGTGEVDYTKFFFGDEKIIWNEKIDEDLIYVITQIVT